MNFKWNSILTLFLMFGFAGSGLGQEDTDTISTVVIDSAPKKLYSELYSDENGNQFMVEIYEEPQEGENLIHFRSFKNGKIIGRKSQALADAHNFSFYIDETEERLMREDSAQLLYEVLKKLMEESDQKLKSNLEDMFDEEEIADQLTEKLANPLSEKLAKPLSEKIRTPDDQIQKMADQISDQITFDGGTVKDMAERISKQIKTPDEQISQMASLISNEIRTPEAQIQTMANQISKQITEEGTVKDMAERISKQIKTPEDQISKMADEISDKITFDGGTVKDMAERISKQIKTPDEQISDMASRISQEVRTPDDQIENMAMSLAIKLTQKERLVAAKIPPYQELITQVSDSNMQQDYEKTIEILDEDIANRTPDEQRKALKISGLMSVLVASKKLKRAISTIEDYDLPDDPELRQVSEALSDWLSKNLVIE